MSAIQINEHIDGRPETPASRAIRISPLSGADCNSDGSRKADAGALGPVSTSTGTVMQPASEAQINRAEQYLIINFHSPYGSSRGRRIVPDPEARPACHRPDQRPWPAKECTYSHTPRRGRRPIPLINN